MPRALLCFHCGEPLAGSTLTATIGNAQQPVCCIGCRAVAELIATAGLDDYYRYRDAPAARPAFDALASDAWSAYSQPEIAAQFTQRSGDVESVDLLIEGLRCAACSWLLDRVLSHAEGVRAVSINAAVGRGHIEWDATTTNLGEIMRTIARVGYRPHVLTDTAIGRAQSDEKRGALKRLAVASFGMMQVMMFSVATYSVDLSGEIMEAGIYSYFRLVSLLVSLPVLFYAGLPFLAKGLRTLRARAIGMDVPVAIALLLAFAASTWNTLHGSGEVYFDSITMFVFFLTLGRFVEMSVRHRTAGITDALARHLPAMAHRLRGEQIEDVPVASLAAHDTLLIKSGEVVPADGTIVEGDTHLDEALLTGESKPVRRDVGNRVTAGTLNTQNPIRVEVLATGSNTVLSGIVNLLRRAQTQKPAMVLAADKVAATFLRYVLISAAVVCGGWLIADPSRAFEATLAVLVVACPCAFAIAMPAALAAASGQLARAGILVTKPDSLQALASVHRVIFDKTGTLTRGEVSIEHCVPTADLSTEECLVIAAALERASSHPIAKAFAGIDTGSTVAAGVKTEAGFGVEGVIDGRRYRLGIAHVAKLRSSDLPRKEWLNGATVVLGDETRDLAYFELADRLRTDSTEAVAQLRKLGIESEMLSGDSHPAVAAVAQRCGITTLFARRSPAQKLKRVEELRASGQSIAMVGDGINDAPVLGAADVSIAMGRGAALAMAAADLVLVNERLASLPEAISVARKTMRIARQNLFWAAAYNLCALPLAAFGLIPPWLAAVGMSASSVAVVLNAMRLAPANKSASAASAAQKDAALAQLGVECTASAGMAASTRPTTSRDPSPATTKGMTADSGATS